MESKSKFSILKRIEEFSLVVKNTKITDSQSNEIPIENCTEQANRILTEIKNQKANLYLIGNGGSAAIASHAAIDFMNVAKISAHTLYDSAVLTCMANDYGYENSFSNIVSCTMTPNDMLIAISSSGKSKNIINATEIANQIGANIMTFSGFEQDNPLRLMGNINFWCNSSDYGMVEVAHQFILHNLSDLFQGVE